MYVGMHSYNSYSVPIPIFDIHAHYDYFKAADIMQM